MVDLAPPQRLTPEATQPEQIPAAHKNSPHTLRTFFNTLIAASILSVPSFARAGEEEKPMPAASTLNKSGSLVIVGGGTIPLKIHRLFEEKAGGKEKGRVVVITTASSKADAPDPQVSDYWGGDPHNVAHVELLHAPTREDAKKESFSKPLTAATAAWIVGGTQEWVSERYVGTPVEQNIHDILARNGVIGGTSAGAAIMSRKMIAGNAGRVNGKMTARMGTGFDLLPKTTLDQHFHRDGRFERLTGVVEEDPEQTGVGIEESTAFVVNLQERVADVVGDKWIWVLNAQGKPMMVKAGQRLNLKTLEPMPLDSMNVESVSVE